MTFFFLFWKISLTKLYFRNNESILQNLHNEKSVQKLTSLDLKYCAAIHSKLNTKQISMLFSVEPESVRMSKYRIKQKLNLDKDDDLELFLTEI